MRRLIPFAAAIATLPFLVPALDRRPPFIYEENRPTNSPVIPGTVLKLQFTGTRLQKCPVEIYEEVVDSRRTPHPLESRKVMPTDEGRIVAVVDVPIALDVAPGLATYRSQVSYRCNWVQRWLWPLVVNRPPVKFEVLQPPVIPVLPLPPQAFR